MRLLFGALSLLLAGTQPALAETSCAAKIGSCEYYQCREQLQSCGDDGYFLRFGYRYCMDFLQQMRPKVAAPQAQWLDQVATCLQTALDAIPTDLSCADTQSAAIASHESCYVMTGFCTLPLETKFQILQVIYRELSDPKIDEVMIRIGADCDMIGF
jgi:hypothetical protein